MRKRFLVVLLPAGCAIGACEWVDSTGAQARTIYSASPVITLVEETEAQLDFSAQQTPEQSDTGWVLVRQGPLSDCQGRIDMADAAPTLSQACAVTEQNCELIFTEQQTTDGTGTAVYNVFPPRLSQPVGLQYRWNDSTQVTFCVAALNEAPIANDDSFTLNQLQPLLIPDAQFTADCVVESSGETGGLLANDIDDHHLRSGCPQVELLQGPSFAANDFTANFTTSGGFVYTPDVQQISSVDFADAVPSDTFTYRVYDGELYSEAATVTLLLLSGPTTPTANFDFYEVNYANANTQLSPLDNDDSPFDLPLRITGIPNQPNRGGQITIESDQSLSYTPADQFSGVEYFSYSIENSLGESATAFVGVRVLR